MLWAQKASRRASSTCSCVPPNGSLNMCWGRQELRLRFRAGAGTSHGCPDGHGSLRPSFGGSVVLVSQARSDQQRPFLFREFPRVGAGTCPSPLTMLLRLLFATSVLLLRCYIYRNGLFRGTFPGCPQSREQFVSVGVVSLLATLSVSVCLCMSARLSFFCHCVLMHSS